MTNFITNIILFSAPFVSGLLVLLFKVNLTKNIKLLISFSGAFLLAISVLHLIPEVFTNYTEKVGVFILIGFLLQLLLEFFSNGIEHGHIHFHKKKMVAFPYAIFISLCIHSFIEGMALISGDHNHGHIHAHSADYSLLLGIIIHKIPIAIVLSVMLLAEKLSKTVFIISLAIFSLSSPLGFFLASNNILPFIENQNLILALAVGIFLHISTTILFESSDGHKFDLKKFLIIIAGFALAMFTL